MISSRRSAAHGCSGTLPSGGSMIIGRVTRAGRGGASGSGSKKRENAAPWPRSAPSSGRHSSLARVSSGCGAPGR